MSIFSRKAGLALLALSALAVTGCAQDNEAFLKAQADAAAASAAGGKANVVQDKSQAEQYNKQQKSLKSSGYPGAN